MSFAAPESATAAVAALHGAIMEDRVLKVQLKSDDHSYAPPAGAMIMSGGDSGPVPAQAQTQTPVSAPVAETESAASPSAGGGDDCDADTRVVASAAAGNV